MKDVLFITVSGRPKLRDEVNGTLLLATILKQADFDVDVLRFHEAKNWKKNYPAFVEEMVERVLEITPRCVSFYCLCLTYHVALRLAMEIRRRAPHITIVFGGPQATVAARNTMENMNFVDYISTGEGENTVVPLFTALLRRDGQGIEEIPGLYYRQDGAVVSNDQPVPFSDLETLPCWDETLLSPESGRNEPDILADDYFMPIDTGRGCPYNCTFCSTSYFWHRKYRLKSAQRIVQDMEYYQKKYGIHSFDMAHDAFTANKKLVEAVCDLIMEKGLDVTWRCTTRIDCISRELLLKMKQAGMRRIALGVESGSPRMQKLINKRLNLDTVKPMTKFLVDNGIKVTLFFMYGFPEETEEELKQTLDLAFDCMDMGVDKANMALCLFDPCTELTKQYYDQLTLVPEVAKMYSRFGFGEEIEMIRNNKFLFTQYYRFDSDLRNNYQYLFYLSPLYSKYIPVMRYIRSFYPNILDFYRAFYSSNRCYFEHIDGAEVPMDRPQEMVYRMLENLPVSGGAQVKAWMEFSEDVRMLAASAEDMQIRKCYDFSLIDYQMKVPLEKLSAARSEILLLKKNGKMDMKLLNLQYPG